MKNFFFQIIEEIFPIVYILYKNKILKNLKKDQEIPENINSYLELNEKQLTNRLLEEHDRASKIDDKTSKFTLALSLSLTILSAINSIFIKLFYIKISLFTKFISILCLLSSIYMLLASIIAVSAYKTLPKYGYGTDYLLEIRKMGKKAIAKNLVSQEKMNIIRHMKNEASYQCIRNGLLLLLITFFITLIYFIINLILN